MRTVVLWLKSHWSRISGPLALFGIPITIAVTQPFWQTKVLDVKNLRYDYLVSPARLTGFSGELWENLGITYKGQPAYSIQFIYVQFKNYSLVPIKKEDFESPLEIIFSYEGEILEARAVAVDAGSGILPKVSIQERVAKIEPLTLNPGDSFSVEFLTDKSVEIQGITGRVAGLKSIEPLPHAEPGRDLWVMDVQTYPYNKSSQRKVFKIDFWLVIAMSLGGWLVSCTAARRLIRADGRAARISWGIVTLVCCSSTLLFTLVALAWWDPGWISVLATGIAVLYGANLVSKKFAL